MRDDDKNRLIQITVGTLQNARLAIEFITAVKSIHCCEVWLEPREDGSARIKARIPKCESKEQSMWYSGALRMFKQLKD